MSRDVFTEHSDEEMARTLRTRWNKRFSVVHSLPVVVNDVVINSRRCSPATIIIRTRIWCFDVREITILLGEKRYSQLFDCRFYYSMYRCTYAAKYCNNIIKPVSVTNSFQSTEPGEAPTVMIKTWKQIWLHNVVIGITLRSVSTRVYSFSVFCFFVFANYYNTERLVGACSEINWP